MSSSINNKYLKFNFDVSAYRLIGRELISDRITALFEIVKNAYDANANEVTIEFINTNSINENSKIIISDDGLGMRFLDLETKWMVIGTSSKRKERISPAPYCRKIVGKKGIGRFAVDLLGSKLTLKTKRKGDSKWIVLETDWSHFSQLEKEQLKLDFEEDRQYFTDIENKYWYEDGNIEEQGTILIIEEVNDIWTQIDLTRAEKELNRIVSPNIKFTSYPFKIKMKSEYEKYKDKFLESKELSEFASLTIDLKYDLANKKQEIILFEGGELVKKEVEPRAFGVVELYLYYFDVSAKRKYKSNYSEEIEGVKIYRDGIITTPFAETESSIDKQKDILGIDKRRYSGFFDKISSRDLIGYLEITDENNSNIIEATNRQDFLDNYAWRELKQFVIDQIHQIEKWLKFERDESRIKTVSNFGKADDDLKGIKRILASIKDNVSTEVKDQLQVVEKELNKLQGTVSKGIKDYEQLEKESKQKENLFFSLVTLQTYASMLSHMIKHSLGHVMRDAEYFKKHFPNEKLNDRFKIISERIYNEFLTLGTGVDFMLKYAKSENSIEDINLNELVQNLFFNIYSKEFKKNHIDAKVEFDKDLDIKYNKKAFEDIFDNLISNSLKALKNTDSKVIRCKGIVEKEQIRIYFSDNSDKGIKEEDKYRVFDIFFTKTADDGGAGIGLYMVKTQVESMKGTIEVVESEFAPKGTTFEIILPFKK